MAQSGAHASGSARDDAFLVRLDDLIRPLELAEELTRAAARLLGEHLDADRCAYADVEGDEDTFNLTGDYNRGVPSIVGRYRFAQFGAECLRLMRAGEPYIVADSENDGRTTAVRDAYRQTLIRAVICVPVAKSGRFVAAMAVHQAVPRTWSPYEVALVQRVADRCWESIERARIGRELRASESRLRTALEAARQVAWEYAPPAGDVRCSHTVTAVLGLTLHDGRVPLSAWDACIHPADRAERLARIALALQQDSRYRAEFRWRRPDDGSVLWVEEHGHIAQAAADGRVSLLSGMIADISRHKAAEIERERFFALGLDLMVVAGFDGHLQRVSPAWERTLGWTAEELTTQPWLSFIHPDDHAASIKEAERLFAGADTSGFENRYRCKDGSWRWLSWKLTSYPEERLLYGAASDITERKRGQEHDAFLIALDDAIRPLSEPEDITRVASLMLGGHLHADRCVHCVFEADGDSLVLNVHPLREGLAPMGGRMSLNSFGTEIRQRFAANQPAIFSDVTTDPASADACEEYLRYGIRSHVSVPLIKGGRIAAAWGLHQTTPRTWLDDEIALLRRVADRCWESLERARAVADLRQQWLLFDSALSHTPDFTYIFDCDGRFLYINRALLSLWQKPFAEARGKNFFELGYPPELAERLQCQIQEVIITRGQVRDQTPFTGPTGVTRHYEYIFVPIFAEDGGISGVAGSTRDITDRLQTEEDLRLLNDKLGRSNRELEQFAYIASHDLQEPLRMVSSFVTLLERRSSGDLNEAARSYIARAKDGTVRMQTLIRDLLAYARVGEPRQFTTVDLLLVLRTALDHLGTRIEEAAAVVTNDALPQVLGDEVQLVQLFQNLIGNAIKFRAPGRAPRIHLSALNDGTAWTVAIADNGIGVAADQRQRIFEVFHRAHHQADYEGTGIGLAICKKIVEQHGGAIALESQEGEGSTFLIRLPCSAVVSLTA